MMKKRLLLILYLALSYSWLNACGLDVVEEDAYYYSLELINNPDDDMKNYERDISLYLVDPVNEKVVAMSVKNKKDDQPYNAEMIEDTDETLSFTYNGVTEFLDKKSNSLYKSSKTGIEYSVERFEEPLINENNE